MERRVVKRLVCASARAEARVPMCKVRGLEAEAEAEAEVAAGGDDIIGGRNVWVTGSGDELFEFDSGNILLLLQVSNDDFVW